MCSARWKSISSFSFHYKRLVSGRASGVLPSAASGTLNYRLFATTRGNGFGHLSCHVRLTLGLFVHAIRQALSPQTVPRFLTVDSAIYAAMDAGSYDCPSVTDSTRPKENKIIIIIKGGGGAESPIFTKPKGASFLPPPLSPPPIPRQPQS